MARRRGRRRERRKGARTKRLAGELLGALAFSAAGLGLLCLVPTATLSCERTAHGLVPCRLEWHILFDLVRIRNASIAQLEDAEVASQRNETSERGTPGYHLKLYTAAGPLRASAPSYSMSPQGSWKQAESGRDRIRAFLADGYARKLRLVHEPRGTYRLMRWVASALLLLGLLYWIYLPATLHRWVELRSRPGPGGAS
jgi:hypothetical protein